MRCRWPLIAFLLFLPLLAGPATAADTDSGRIDKAVVRIGEHPGFSRLVLDFARLPAYESRAEGAVLRIRFRDPVTVLLPPLEKGGLKNLRTARWSPEERMLEIVTVPGAPVRLWTSEKRKLVIDVYAPASGQAAPRSAETANAPSPALQRSEDKDQASHSSSPEPAELVATAATEKKAAASHAPMTSPAPAPGKPLTDHGVALTMQPGAGPRLAIGYTRDPEGFALVLRLPPDIGFAAFKRGNLMWLALERPVMVAIDRSSPLAAEAARLLTPFRRLDRSDATILYAEMREPRDLSVSERGGRWYVYLKDTETIPRAPLKPVVDRSEGEARLFVPVADPGARIDFTDPLLGDRLVVVPVSGDGQGLMETRRYPQFALLKSAQGVVVQPFDDAIRVRRFANGVAIEADGGLDLSPEMLSRALTNGVRPHRLIDLAAWRGDQRKSYQERESAYLVRLSLATPPERPKIRWDLARFYLGHRMAPESYAQLQLLADSNKAFEKTPAFRAALGIALYRLHRPQQALEHLLDPRLDPEMEIWLWRALAFAGLGLWEDAAKAYLKGREALHEQDPDVAIEMRLMAVRSFLALKDWERAEDEIEQLEALPLPPRARVETALRRAQLLEGKGDMTAAIAAYEDVAHSRDRRLSVEARFALARLRLAAGDMTVQEAIEELERLRYAWRGDELEIRILDRLGELYRDHDQPRKALDVWSVAAANFPNEPEVRAISRKMLDLFRHLFLDGAADKLPAVEALGLFYDFRELTPLGADGDRMIRRLARRLVSLGLYGRAAELLAHQVRYRLEGAAQASVAVPLAAIYLLDHQPQKAIEILRATRVGNLPPQLIAERRRIESQALAAMGRADEAAALLDRATDTAGLLLRAHYFWQVRDWPRLIATLRPLFMGAQPLPQLTEPLRRGLLEYALALSLEGRSDELAALRARYRDRIGRDALAGLFDLLTSPDSPGTQDLANLSEIMSKIGSFSPTSEDSLRRKVLAALADRALTPAQAKGGKAEEAAASGEHPASGNPEPRANPTSGGAERPATSSQGSSATGRSAVGAAASPS